MQGIGVVTLTLMLVILPLGFLLVGREMRKRKLKSEKLGNANSKKLENPAQALMLAGGFFLTLAGEGTRQLISADAGINPNFLTGIGILLFIGGLLPSNSDFVQAINRNLHTRIGTENFPVENIIFIAASFILAWIAYLAAGDQWLMHSPFAAIISWLLSIISITLAFIDWESISIKLDKRILLAAIGLFMVALLLRIFDLEGIPNTLTGDEGSSGLFAKNFVDRSADNLFGFGWFSFPSFYFYIQSISITLFGQTIFALRIWSAFIGASTVLLIYLAGRKIFNNQIALIAAIFLAGSHFHIHFSRLGLNNIWDAFWFLLILSMIILGVRSRKNNALVLAGLALGIAQYFYVSSRMLYVLIPVWFLINWLWGVDSLKDLIKQLGIVVVTSVAVVFPLGANFVKYPGAFWAPFQRASIFDGWLEAEAINFGIPQWRLIANNIWISINSFTGVDLKSWYTPDSPILRNFSAGFFLLGIVFVLSRFRKRESSMLMLWLLAFVFTGAFSDSTPAAQRYVAVMPAVALVLAIGISESLDRLAAVFQSSKRNFALIGFVIATLLAIDDAYFYLSDFTNKGPYGGGNNAIARQVIENLEEKEENWTVAFFGYPRMGYSSINSTTFLLPHVSGIDMIGPWGSSENENLGTGNVFYVFLPEHDDSFQLARTQFPEFQRGEEFDENGYLLFNYLIDSD